MVYRITNDITSFLRHFPTIGKKDPSRSLTFFDQGTLVNFTANPLNTYVMDYRHPVSSDHFSISLHLYQISYEYKYKPSKPIKSLQRFGAIKHEDSDIQINRLDGVTYFAITVGDLLKWVFKMYPKEGENYTNLMKKVMKLAPEKTVNRNIKQNLHTFYNSTGFHDLNRIRKDGFLQYLNHSRNLDESTGRLILFDSSTAQRLSGLDQSERATLKNWTHFLENLIAEKHRPLLINQCNSLGYHSDLIDNGVDKFIIDIKAPKSISDILLQLFNQTQDETYMIMHRQINQNINNRMKAELKQHYHYQVFDNIHQIHSDDYPAWALQQTYIKNWSPNDERHLHNIIDDRIYKTYVSRGKSRNRYKQAREIGSKNLNKINAFMGCDGCGICSSERWEVHIKNKRNRMELKKIDLELKKNGLEDYLVF